MRYLRIQFLLANSAYSCVAPAGFSRPATSFDVHVSALMAPASRDSAEANCVSQGAELFGFDEPGDIAVLDSCKRVMRERKVL